MYHGLITIGAAKEESAPTLQESTRGEERRDERRKEVSWGDEMGRYGTGWDGMGEGRRREGKGVEGRGGESECKLC